MTIYVQYDPTTADSNNNVWFSTVSIPDRTDGQYNPPAPQPPSNITQITFPDNTQVSNLMLNLSTNPPALVIPS